MMNLLREGKAMEYIPWQQVNALTNIAVRWQTLPSVAFRQINEGYTPSHGDTEQVWESVYGLGGEIQVDRVWKLVSNYVKDPVQDQMDMKLKAMAFKFNDHLINGDLATDAKGFEGLKKRVSNMPSRQAVNFGGAGAAALDPTASVANGNTFFTKFEEVVYKCNAGDCQALFMNEGMKWGIGRVARFINASGGMFLDVTKDSFERDVLTYKGIPLVDIGFKADQSTEIITDTEVAGDAGTDATSIYGVSFNGEQALTGIQLEPLNVYDPLKGGEQETTPTTLKRIDWWVGLANFGSYSITRGQNVEGASNW